MANGLTKMDTMTPIPTQITQCWFHFSHMIVKNDCVTHNFYMFWLLCPKYRHVVTSLYDISCQFHENEAFFAPNIYKVFTKMTTMTTICVECL